MCCTPLAEIFSLSYFDYFLHTLIWVKKTQLISEDYLCGNNSLRIKRGNRQPGDRFPIMALGHPCKRKEAVCTFFPNSAACFTRLDYLPTT
ncbi:hypothetical protein CEXT_105961 [Caerostris extrusa]|uniref:Uncharacterized protein n=1 Tax=Caerostris extrusa TaxID=172846 RepID=A0AAV4WXM9_CAEEX|nr:hypothetical protein CEXT_105961 [Caerostris extrusa]